MVRLLLVLALATAVVAQSQFLGSSVYLYDAFLSKVAQFESSGVSTAVSSTYTHPAVTDAALPNLPSCSISHEALGLTSLTIGSAAASSTTSGVSTVFSNVAFQTTTIEFHVLCKLVTPAGNLRMSARGTFALSASNQVITTQSTLSLSSSTSAPVAEVYNVVGDLGTTMSYAYHTSTEKFPLDAYVVSYLSGLQGRIEEELLNVFTGAGSGAVALNTAYNGFFTMFSSTCNIESTSGFTVFNQAPVCATITNIVPPTCDLFMVGPAQNNTARSQLRAVQQCSGVSCWAPLALPAATVYFGSCEYCESAHGKFVGESTVVTFSGQ